MPISRGHVTMQQGPVDVKGQLLLVLGIELTLSGLVALAETFHWPLFSLRLSLTHYVL